MSEVSISELVGDIFNDDKEDNMFQVSDKVYYHGMKAEIFGVTDGVKEKYAVKYTTPAGRVRTNIAEENQLERIKSKDKLEKGDRFECAGIYEVKCRHEDSNGAVYYLAIDEEGDCDLVRSDYIEEVL